MARFASVGLSLPRPEGETKVTGGCRFTADVLRPRTLWGKVLRSPVAHARILSLDISQAERLPGVRAVITAEDVNSRLVGKTLKDIPVLARDRVRYVGEAVAAVAATDKDAAEEAISVIHMEYEELPAVFDPLAAMQPEAPLIHPDYATYQGPAKSMALDMRNVQSVIRASKGDVERGFAESDHVFEHTFRTQVVHQGYIEPSACLVEVDGEGRVRVWAAQQSPFSVRDQLAEYLGVPKERVVFHPVTVGGSFGGKDHLLDIPLAYYLARSAGCPVKIVRTYGEELMAGCPRHPSVISLRSGVKRDGTLRAREARVIYNGGAYGSYKPSGPAHMSGGLTQGGAYHVPHTRLESLCVYTNQVPGGYMRASGELQTVFAVESHMDVMAADLGIDPLEFRLRNALKEGDENYAGFRYRDIKCREVLKQAARVWRRPKAKPRRPGNLIGRGMALTCRHVGFGEAGAELVLQEDGAVKLVTGILDQGVGVHTIQKQIVAEILAIAPDRVQVEVADTNHAPYHDGIKGQGATHIIGQAVARATHALVDTLKARAAVRWGVGPERVEWSGGAALLKGERGKLDLRQLAALAPGEPGRGYAYYIGERPKEHIFQAAVADVEVDPQTGAVEVRGVHSFHDVSVVINPLTHQGQIEGGLIQGLGMALCEEVGLEEGRVTTLSLGDYKIPNVRDVPPHGTTLVEGATHGPGPFNAKPAAEHAITPVPPAVANAVFDATGVRITELPISAEKVLRGLRERGK